MEWLAQLNNNITIITLGIVAVVSIIAFATGRLSLRWSKGKLIVNGADNEDALYFKKLCTDVDAINMRLKEGALEFEKHTCELKAMALSVDRLVITNEMMPLPEREKAYKEYKSFGGNGYMDIYYKEVLEPELTNFYKQQIHNGGQNG